MLHKNHDTRNKSDLLKNTRNVFLLLVLFGFLLTANIYAENKPDKIVLAAAHWEPFVYKDKQGNLKGMYIDILKEIFEKPMNIEVEFLDLPWKRAQHSVKQGTADFLITIATKERLEYAVKSDSYFFEMYLNVFTYQGHPQYEKIKTITSGADIRRLGLSPVTNLGNLWHKNNIDSFGVKTHYVPSEENALKVLAARRADITIEPLIGGIYLIKQLGLSSQIRPTKAKFGPLIFHFLMSKKSKYLSKMSQINTEIEKLHTSGRLQEILNSYLKID